MLSNVKVGCCGYRYYRPPKKKQKYKQKLQAYADEYSLVEINSSFYQLPKVSTAKKWRWLVDEVNPGFVFTLKANQRITHLPSSPTYKKLKIPEEEKDKYGYFRSTEQVFQAWEETKEICKALKAKVCLFQCPASFKPTKENLENLENFFSQAKPETALAFEPRGRRWEDKIIKRICQGYQVIHAVDPFKRKPVFLNELAYFRLHGLGKKAYEYKFTNEDLKKLYQTCKGYKKEVYVLFNNYQMFLDSKRFSTYLETGKLSKVPWGAEAVVDTIEIDFPTTKQEILDKCGNWWCWIKPDKRIRVKQLLKQVEKEEFESKKELLEKIVGALTSNL